MLRQTR